MAEDWNGYDTLTAKVGQEVPPMEMAIEHLARVNSALGDAIQDLTGRLASVCVPAAGGDAREIEKNTPVARAPLVQTIHTHACHMENHLDAITSLLNRLSL